MQSRRDFLSKSTALGSLWTLSGLGIASISQISCDRAQKGAAFVNFSEQEAEDLEAVAAQIIPSDETPGAREAGVIHFIDTAVSEGMAFRPMFDLLKSGLNQLDINTRARDASPLRFALADDASQIELLEGMEETPFFGVATTLTKLGFLVHPKYGGNRDKLAWKMIGYEDLHSWQPPFGFYDAQAMKEEGHE